MGALGVHDDDAVGMLGAERGDVFGLEPLVDRAVALPQQERRLLDVGLGEVAGLAPGIPEPHVLRVVAEVERGVAAEVLVGEEQHLATAGALALPLTELERPLEDGPGVGRRAHGAAVLAHEGLQRGRRVHVGDRDQALDVGGPLEHLPRLFDLVEIGHVGHRTTGVQIGQHHLLVVAGEDVGRLGHEVHAAEHDVLGVGMLLGQHGQDGTSRRGHRPTS